MISPEAVLAMSLIVKDAGGLHPLKPIAMDGAVAIAAECSKKEEEDEQIHCAAFYIAHGFRESGLQLRAPGDCVDHLWDTADEGYRKTHRKYYQPNADGKCRPGDGEPTSYGPFQTRSQPKTWAIAVEDFSRTLKRAEEVCVHDDKDLTCTPLEVVATGRTRSKIGKQIARARYAEAERIEREYLFRDDPKASLPSLSPSITSGRIASGPVLDDPPPAGSPLDMQ